MSVQKLPCGPSWPLGFVKVTASGTPVNLMVNVDANNNNAPGVNQGNPGAPTGSEYTPNAKAIWLYGYKPGANNNGFVANTGIVYVNWNPGGNNNQNRNDAGSIVGLIPANGGSFVLPQSLADPGVRFSPYSYTIDADVSGEGAIVVLVDPRGQ
jgi:hypothetical protein